MTKYLTRLAHAFFSKQYIYANLHFVVFALILCLLIPIVYTFVTWYFGRIANLQFGRALGTSSQMVVGGIGNFIHEMENIFIARIGGHRISNVRFNTVYCYKYLGYMGNADHNWQSSTIYQSLFDFFIGAVPAYVTTLLLWGIQCMLGTNNFIPRSSMKLTWNSLWDLKPALYHGFSTAFSTGNIFTDVIYLFFVLIVASTAFSISKDELHRTQNGLIIWVPLLIITASCIAFFGKINNVLPVLWEFGYFSAFGLGRIVAYLFVIIFVMTAFAIINHFWKDIRALF